MLKEGGIDSPVWEYRNQLRSGFQPFIAWMAWHAFGGDSPFATAFITRLLSVMLSLAAVAAFWNAAKAELQTESARRWVLAAMLLPGVFIFYHVRFSSEGWMASFMPLGAGCLLTRRFTWGGMFFGLAFICRYQAGFMLLPLVLYVAHSGIKNILLMAAGGAAVLAASFFIDTWFYDAPTLPWLNYLKFHTSTTVADNESAWMYWYKGGLYAPFIGYALPIVIIGFWFMFPRHVLTWATCLYVLFHLWNDNRQLRFMLPVLIFAPIMTALMWEHFIRHRATLKKWFLRILILSAALNVPLALYATFFPAAKEVKLLRECVVPYAAAKVYFLDKGNIRQDLGLDFYLNNTAEIIPVQDEQEIAMPHGDMPVLYITRKNRETELRQSGVSFDFVCSALPKWLLKYDFNNWTKRASSYPVYEIKKTRIDK